MELGGALNALKFKCAQRDSVWVVVVVYRIGLPIAASLVGVFLPPS